MRIEENKEVIRLLWEAFNRNDSSKMVQCLHDNFTRYAHDGTTMDKDGYMKFCEWIFQNSSDSKVIVNDMVAEGDKVAFRMTLSGKNDDKIIAVKEAYFARIESGQIVDFYNIHCTPMEVE